MLAVFFTWFLVFVRASAFLTILPIFSATNVPVRLRIGLAAVLGMMVVPGITHNVDAGRLGLLDLVLVLFGEISLGLLLGFVARLVFYAIQLAGHFISTEMGLQTSTLITPTDSVPVDVPAAVLNLLGMMLFLSLDVHHTLMVVFQRTYEILPIAGGGISNGLFDDLTLRCSKILLLGVQMAAPLMAVSFLLSTVLMMLGRAVPQMNIFFESFSMRLLAGLFVFGFSMNLASQWIANHLRRIPQDILEVARLVGGA